MNSENFLKVADAIEKDLSNFDMEVWCGTACCVAGFAFMLAMDGRNNPLTANMDNVIHAAKSYLGLDDALNLFAPNGGVSILTINDNKELVPDALRWMAHNKCTDWKPALDAAWTAAKCRQDSPSSPPMSPGTSEPEVVTA